MSKKNTVSKAIPTPALLPPPSTGEQAAITSARTRVAARAPRFAVQARQDENGKLEPLGPDHTDASCWIRRLEDAFGSSGTTFPATQLQYLIRASQDSAGKVDVGKLNGMLAFIDGTRPEGEL